MGLVTAWIAVKSGRPAARDRPMEMDIVAVLWKHSRPMLT